MALNVIIKNAIDTVLDNYGKEIELPSFDDILDLKSKDGSIALEIYYEVDKSEQKGGKEVVTKLDIVQFRVLTYENGVETEEDGVWDFQSFQYLKKALKKKVLYVA